MFQLFDNFFFVYYILWNKTAFNIHTFIFIPSAGSIYFIIFPLWLIMDRNARKRPPLNNELLLKQGCFPCAACEILDQFTHGSTSGLSHVLCSTNPASTATNPHLKVIPSTILSKNQKNKSSWNWYHTKIVN